MGCEVCKSIHFLQEKLIETRSNQKYCLKHIRTYQNLFETFPKHVPNLFKTGPKYFGENMSQNSSNIVPDQCLNMFQTCPKLDIDMICLKSRHIRSTVVSVLGSQPGGLGSIPRWSGFETLLVTCLPRV